MTWRARRIVYRGSRFPAIKEPDRLRRFALQNELQSFTRWSTAFGITLWQSASFRSLQIDESVLFYASRFVSKVGNFSISSAANHGTSINSSFTRSQGGFPITASKPPLRSALIPLRPYAGEHYLPMEKAFFRNEGHAPFQEERRGVSHPGFFLGASPRAISTGSPNEPKKKVVKRSLCLLYPEGSTSRGRVAGRGKASSDFVPSSTSAKRSADSWASAISASVSLSTSCIGVAVSVARSIDSRRNSEALCLCRSPPAPMSRKGCRRSAGDDPES